MNPSHFISEAFTVTLQNLCWLFSPYLTNRRTHSVVKIFCVAEMFLEGGASSSTFPSEAVRVWFCWCSGRFRCLSLHHANELSNNCSVNCLGLGRQGRKLQLVHVAKQTHVSNSNSSWLFEVNGGEWYMCSVWLGWFLFAHWKSDCKRWADSHYKWFGG